jgi:hypothetical protein
MDGASKATLENEFGTTNDEEVIKQILEKGSLQESEVRNFPCLPLSRIQSPSEHPMLTLYPHRPPRDKATRMTAWVPDLHTRGVGSDCNGSYD